MILKKHLAFFESTKKSQLLRRLKEYGRKGVDALTLFTPQDTGLTSSSWRYEIYESRHRTVLQFLNSNPAGTVSIAILIQYGHGTRNGGYVIGRDFINPAIQPLFDKMSEDIWKEVVACE